MPAPVQMPPEEAKLLLLSALAHMSVLAPAGAPKKATVPEKATAPPPPPSPLPPAPQRKVPTSASPF